MRTTILVPLDGSPLAERALPYATALARGTGARLILLRAVLAHTFLGTDPTEAQAVVVQHAETEVAAVADRLRADGVTAEPHVYYGEAAEAITDSARHQHADLIVMSTHGRTGLGRWVYGSVADRVLRRAEAPLLLIPATSERPWPSDRPLRILVALDGSQFAEEALGPAVELAAPLGAELLLLRVVEPPVPIVADGVSYAQPFDEEHELGEARRYLEEVATRLRAGGRTVAGHAEVGHPPTVIAEVTRERGIDLVTMATHGRGGLARVVLGSVATGTLQRASTPLLLVRPTGVKAAATTTAAPKPADRPVTVTLNQRELHLVQQGLAELLHGWEREAGARVSATPDGRAVSDLLARLRQAEPVVAAQRDRGPHSP
jgi:nucleotide-binding universal stress UspA family protein